MGAVIRQADASDLPFLQEHEQHVRADEVRRAVEQEHVLVAEVDGDLVGWLRWGLFWDATPFMYMLFVLAASRGQGVGTELIGTWEARMADAGFAELMTSSLASETAQHLYRRLGYVDAGALLLPGEPAELMFFKDFRTPPER